MVLGRLTKIQTTSCPDHLWLDAWTRIGKAARGGLEGESKEPRPTEPTDDTEARRDFWSVQGDFIYRHHDEPRVQLYVPKEETLPIPLKYIDVTRSTHTNLDLMQEKRIDDDWNVHENRNLSGSWTGFTKFIRFKEEPPKECVQGETTTGFTSFIRFKWSREGLTKVQTTVRSDHVWPEVWTKMEKAAQRREEQEWANEKPKLELARKKRGIYFIDLEDEESQETVKNARSHDSKRHEWTICAERSQRPHCKQRVKPNKPSTWYKLFLCSKQ